jgi:hypothetical protein
MITEETGGDVVSSPPIGLLFLFHRFLGLRFQFFDSFPDISECFLEITGLIF